MAPERYNVAFHLPSVTPLVTESGVSPGGAETQIYLLSRELARRGARVCIIAFDSADGHLPGHVDGVDVVARPPYPPHQPLPAKVREAARILQSVRTVEADAVVTRTAGAQVGIVAAGAKLGGKRFVYSSANISDFDFRVLEPTRRDQRLYHLGVKLADQVIVQTEEQVAMCARTFGKKAVLIKSLVEPTRPPEQAPEVFLWIGRLVWYKRPLAFVDLARSLPDIHFQMVATPSPAGSMDREVAAAAQELPNLELLGPQRRSALMNIMDRAVAIVNTADFEGMPNIFLEGWARGIPALALTHDPGGVIARQGLGEFAQGRPERLTDGAERLWLSRFERSELQRRCRKYVASNHSADVVAAQWLDALGLSAGRSHDTTEVVA